MNLHGKMPPGGEARLRYLDADFEILREGGFVRCAATGDPIALGELRYWDVNRQLPYKTAAAAFAARAGNGGQGRV